jgi:hypothetical protein
MERARKRARITADLTEDRGSKVVRDSCMVPTASQTYALPSGTEGWTPSLNELEPSIVHSAVSTMTPTLNHNMSPTSLSMVPGQALDVRTISSQPKSMLLAETRPIQPPCGELERRNPNQGVAENRNKSKRVKRYKKDEIDHIFGF